MSCKCGASFRSAEDYRDHLPCESAVEKAVREEREAIVRFIAKNQWCIGNTWIGEAIWRGEHRK